MGLNVTLYNGAQTPEYAIVEYGGGNDAATHCVVKNKDGNLRIRRLMNMIPLTKESKKKVKELEDRRRAAQRELQDVEYEAAALSRDMRDMIREYVADKPMPDQPIKYWDDLKDGKNRKRGPRPLRNAEDLR